MLLSACKSSSFAFEWFSIESQMGCLLGNGLLHSFCIGAWIKLDFSFVSSRTDKDVASLILFFKGTGTRTEGTFPFTRFNAHIEFSHNKVEFGERKKEAEEKQKKRFFFFFLWRGWDGNIGVQRKCHMEAFFKSTLMLWSLPLLPLWITAAPERGLSCASPPPLHQYINYVKHHWKYTWTQQI